MLQLLSLLMQLISAASLVQEVVPTGTTAEFWGKQV